MSTQPVNDQVLYAREKALDHAMVITRAGQPGSKAAPTSIVTAAKVFEEFLLSPVPQAAEEIKEDTEVECEIKLDQIS